MKIKSFINKSLYFSFFCIIVITLSSCKDDSLKQKELDLKQRELDLKEKELEIATQNNKISNDSSKKITNDTLKNIESKNKNFKEIIKDAKSKFREYLPKIERNHDGILDLMEIYTGDFTGDSLEDIAIFFTLSKKGTNSIIWEGIVFYENTGLDAKVIAGYEPNYLFHFDKIKSGKIYITKDEYTETDPHCCPSIHTPKELTIVQGKVYERDIK